MPRSGRRAPDEPPAVRAAQDRERHREQVTAYPFLARSGPKRRVTVTPSPLRYWQYSPARAYVVALVAVALVVWLGYLGAREGSAAVVDELRLAVPLAVVVLVFSTGRLTVSDTALSTDIAGLRQTSSFGVVTLGLVQDVVAGPPPAGWPRARRRGGWLPGRRRVSVRHLAPDGETERAFTVWVRDPERFADALGRPLR